MPSMHPSVAGLARISTALHAQYLRGNEAWATSPFGWIKTRPSRQIGAIGERMVADWLTQAGFAVAKSPDSDADRLVNGRRAEIKFSSLWEAGGYRFQQLRDQAYDFAICIGISPQDAHCWVIPKADILRLWRKERRIASQHGGAGGSDTAWIGVDPQDVPAWLRPYGGTLDEALAQLRRLAP